MAEFKPLTDKNVIINSVVIDGVERRAVSVYDDSINAISDAMIQKDRIMRNDDIVIAVFKYIRELKAITGDSIRVSSIIERLDVKIIADYPVEVR